MKFLFKQIKQKPTEYFVLGLIFISSIIFYFVFKKSEIVYITAALYFCWSIYHHYHRGDLQLSLVIEYLAFILFGLVVLAATF